MTPIAQPPPLEPDPETVDHLDENEESLPDGGDAAKVERGKDDLAKADQELAR
jgi:hypothetical protein